MPASAKGPVLLRFASLCGFGLACTIAVGTWGESRGVAPAESAGMGEPQERWTHTTEGHFSWYALLALAPIYRDQIGIVVLDHDRVYLGVERSDDVQFLALDRHHGRLVWERHLPFNGYATGKRFVQAGARLVAALYDLEAEELVILGLNRADGTIVWRVTLPGTRRPAVYEEILEADPGGNTVAVHLPQTKQRNRLVLRAADGQRLAETSYNGYLWPFGARRTPGFVFGYDGIRDERKYDRLLAFHEKTAQLAWTLPLSPRSSPPSVVEDSLLIASGDKLLRRDLKTGHPLWTINLGGRIPVGSDSPLVIGPRVLMAHTVTPDPQDRRWRLGIYRLADGAQEAEVAVGLREFDMPRVWRRMGDLAIVASGFVVQVVDPRSASIVATLDFKKLFSWFVYSDLPDMHVADSDAQGFVVVTTDGRLRYFAAEDFRGSQVDRPDVPAGMPAASPAKPPRPGAAPPGLQVLFYLVVNPLWDVLQPNRLAFWVLFYGFPFGLVGLAWLRKPLLAWLRQRGIARGAGWGALIGGFLALPASVYRGLLGGMAAGFGVYGALGPIWGGTVGFGYFLGMGAGLGAAVGVLLSLLRQRRWSVTR